MIAAAPGVPPTELLELLLELDELLDELLLELELLVLEDELLVDELELLETLELLLALLDDTLDAELELPPPPPEEPPHALSSIVAIKASNPTRMKPCIESMSFATPSFVD